MKVELQCLSLSLASVMLTCLAGAFGFLIKVKIKCAPIISGIVLEMPYAMQLDESELVDCAAQWHC